MNGRSKIWALFAVYLLVVQASEALAWDVVDTENGIVSAGDQRFAISAPLGGKVTLVEDMLLLDEVPWISLLLENDLLLQGTSLILWDRSDGFGEPVVPGLDEELFVDELSTKLVGKTDLEFGWKNKVPDPKEVRGTLILRPSSRDKDYSVFCSFDRKMAPQLCSVTARYDSNSDIFIRARLWLKDIPMPSGNTRK